LSIKFKCILISLKLRPFIHSFWKDSLNSLILTLNSTIHRQWNLNFGKHQIFPIGTFLLDSFVMVFIIHFIILLFFINVVFPAYVNIVIQSADCIITLDVLRHHSNPCHSLLAPLLLACNSIY
jgi:hypothetical protein